MGMNALLLAMRRGQQSGIIGSTPLVINLTLLGLDACTWFLTVEADVATTVTVELSFDGGSTYVPANPPSAIGTTVTGYVEYTYSRSPGELYPNRVRLTRTNGTSSASTYGIGPVVSQTVVAQGRYLQTVVNAPGRDLQLADIGCVLRFPSAQNSALRIPAEGSSLIGGRSWMPAGQVKYPCCAVLRQGDGQVAVVGEADSGGNPLVTILGLDRVSPNDKLLLALMMIDLNVWLLS